MGYATGIDWLRGTMQSGTDIGQFTPKFTTLGDAIKPLPPYDMAYELLPAGRLDMATKNRKQGHMVTFTGADMRTLRGCGLNDVTAVEGMLAVDTMKLTRVDLAVDITDTYASPNDLLIAFHSGKAKTRVKTATQIIGWDKEANRTGNTGNFGSRFSETFMRAYDKALETIIKNKVKEQELIENLRALDYQRVEVELKGKRAILAGAAICKAGVAKTLRTTLDGFIKFPTVVWWNDMLENLPIADTNLMKGTAHITENSDHWLHTQALPAVIKAITARDWFVIDAIENSMGGVDIVCGNPRQLKLFD